MSKRTNEISLYITNHMDSDTLLQDVIEVFNLKDREIGAIAHIVAATIPIKTVININNIMQEIAKATLLLNVKAK